MNYIKLRCIAFELITNKPFLYARNETEHVKMMLEICGTPDEYSWPEIINCDKFKALKPEKYHQRRLVSHIR